MFLKYQANILWLVVAQAGETLNGMVLLKVRRPISGGKVRLLLFGKEKASVHAGRSKAFASERNLLTVYQTLKEFPLEEKISPDVYHLPFKLKLPSSMPSTEKYPEGRSKPANGFRIQYKLQVSLGTLQKTVDLHIRSAPLSTEPLPCMVEPSSFPISTLKLIKQGEVVLGASVADSAVGRSEDLELRLACRNDSTIDIRRVAIKLVETMEWRIVANGMIRQSSRTLVHLRDVHLPSLSKDRKERKEVRRRLKDSNRHSDSTYQEIYEDLVSGVEKLDVFIPENSRDSYDGQLVKISHMLHVELLTRGISSNASVKIPIRIGTPRSRPTYQVNTAGGPAIHFETCSHSAVDTRAGEIPVVEAIQVNSLARNGDDDDIQSVIILGSDAVLPAHTELSELRPIPPPTFSMDVSVANMLERMGASTDVYSFVSSLMLEPAWVRLFCSMSPSDFASIISATTPVSEQPRVAALLAEYVNGGDDLTCPWAAAATKATDPYYRASTVQRLLPLCAGHDVLQNHTMLLRELTAWEQTVTREDFEQALDRARRRSDGPWERY